MYSTTVHALWESAELTNSSRSSRQIVWCEMNVFQSEMHMDHDSSIRDILTPYVAGG